MLKVILSIVTLFFSIIIYYWYDMPSKTHIWASSMAELVEEHRTSFSAMNKTAFVLGYTGETGKALVQELVTSKVFSRVVLIGRREVQFEDEAYKDLEQRVVDFDALDSHSDAFSGLEVGFCCMGTTRGKAGKDGFYKVDHDYVVNSAKVAKEGGCSHFHLVSSQGANHESGLLYPQTKGKVEEELKAMNFDRLSIYRPAMLMCERQESRPIEAFARFCMKPIQYAFPTLITIPTSTVAKAMINAAVSPSEESVQTFDNKAIHILSTDLKSKHAKKESKKEKADSQVSE